jgi:tRNA (guanine-N7-)-methyltransferase
MEIGFGHGEHTAALLRAHPSVGVIGVEAYKGGVTALLKTVRAAQDSYEGRLRIVPEDVRTYLPLFPRAQLARIYVLFSDPWPKKRHHKRRLVDAGFLTHCAQLLKPGGLLIVAHDDVPYMTAILELLNAQETFVWHEGARTPTEPWAPWPAAWPLTRYGAKALDQGRALAFSSWSKGPLRETIG